MIQGLCSLGTTVVLTTHYLDEAEQLADRVGVMARGKMVAEGTPAELMSASPTTTISFELPHEVDPAAFGEPTEDGTPVEERAKVRFVPLSRALAACAEGVIGDIKTELAIRRLADRERNG